ncbi:MAG: hypothetical protein ACJAT2_001807 [Bacteriovoracaceae bacterium]|jgi:hypothetical protein
MKILLLLMMILSVSCATLSEDECKSSDWYSLGLTNGKEGRNLLSAHTKACSEYSIQPDIVKYNNGLEQGLKSYCTEENGYREGVAGKSYQRVCPIRLEVNFLKKYKLGKKIHDNLAELRRLEGDVDRINSQLASADSGSSSYNRLKNEKYSKESEINLIKKKLIFLKARSGYDLEDIVDYF